MRLHVEELERLPWPDLMVIGGANSKEFDECCHAAPARPAQIRNDVGIVGAALAYERCGR